MSRTLLLSSLSACLLLPAASLAAEQRPSEQVMSYATQHIASAEEQLATLREKLNALRAQRDTQEEEFYKSFSALHDAKVSLMQQRNELHAWLAAHLQEQNALLATIQIVGGPSNVLKERARQRQLMNATKLFEMQRDDRVAILEEKEQEWQRQWDALTASQANVRNAFNQEEQTLLSQIEDQERRITSINWMRITGRSENELRDRRMDWEAAQQKRYYERHAKRTATVKAAVKNAKTDNYFTRANPEVVADLQKEEEEAQQEKQAMALKYLMERLGILGPVNDELRASLYLHLFGQAPEDNEDAAAQTESDDAQMAVTSEEDSASQ